MQQLLSLLTLTVLMWVPSLCSPTVGCAVDEAVSPACIPSLTDYYTQVTSIPSRLNERSLAAWTYIERIDLDRVPQVIHEAVCLTKHSCNGVEGLSVESIPISIKIPVLRRNPGCLHHSMEFESVNIACICATARRN
ncbi:interleukin-17F [Clarias gariepinus]